MSAVDLHTNIRNLILADNDLLDSESIISVVGADRFNDPFFCLLHHPKQELDSKQKGRITYISEAGPIHEFNKRTRTLLVNIYDKSYDRCELLLDRLIHLIAQPNQRFGAYPRNITSLRLKVGTVTFEGSAQAYAAQYEMWRLTGAYTIRYVQK